MNENSLVQTSPTPLSSIQPQNRLQKMSKTRFSLGEGTSMDDEEGDSKNRLSSLPDLSTGSSNQDKEGSSVFITYNFSNVNLPTLWEKLNLERRILLAVATFIFPLVLSWSLEGDPTDSSLHVTSVHRSVFSTVVVSCLLPCVSFAAIFGFVSYSWLSQPWSDGAVCLMLWIFLTAEFHSSSGGGFPVLLLAGTAMGSAGVIQPQVFRHVGRVDLIFSIFALVRPSASRSLTLLPSFVRSFSGLTSSMLGFVLARCLARSFVCPDISVPALNPGSKFAQKSKRRKSSPLSHGLQSDPLAVKRRVSLPSLHSKIQQQAPINLDSTLLREAQGILADMMLDPSLPDHLLSGLKVVKNIFKMEWHGGQSSGMSRRSRSQGGMMPSSPGLPPPPDAEEWPEVERSSHKQTKQRRGAAPCVIRCRSATSSWTTTTSATGLPVLELDPGLVRSSGRGVHSTGVSAPSGSNPAASNELAGGRLGLLNKRSGSVQVANSIPVGANLARRSIHVIMTSDYESSGEHGDQVINEGCTDESQPIRSDGQREGGTIRGSKEMKRQKFSDAKQGAGIVKSHSADVFEPAKDDDDDYDGGGDDDDYDDEKAEDVGSGAAKDAAISYEYIKDDVQSSQLLDLDILSRWDFPIFNLSNAAPETLLSRVAYKIFCESGFMDTYSIPVLSFLSFFHALEMGYHDNFYHNRIHATDVLHAVYYMTTQPIPGFLQLTQSHESNSQTAKNEEDSRSNSTSGKHFIPATGNHGNGYGVMASNFPSLELMALYTAAAMHDYDHPGRTNAFLVSIASPVAILYNDRSVLENHHVASAWSMLTSDPNNQWLANLDTAKFKRFRFLVIEAVLATDLKRHFELVAEFNSKVNDVEAPGIDWNQEGDRLMAANMLVKMADINGPCKPNLLHLAWTDRICREFYEQGDEEKSLGVPVSPFMDRKNPQLAKLQESFINHLVSPLCHALSDAGLLPGSFEEAPDDDDVTSSDDEDSDKEENLEIARRHVKTPLVENLKGNVKMWLKHIEAGTTPQSLSMVTVPIGPSDVNRVTLKILNSGERHSDTKVAASSSSSSPSAPNVDKAVNRPLTPAEEFAVRRPAQPTPSPGSSTPSTASPLNSPSLPTVTSSPARFVTNSPPTKIKPIHLQPLKFTVSKGQTFPQADERKGEETSKDDDGAHSSFLGGSSEQTSTENLNQTTEKRRPLRIVKLDKT